jgi:hypothetical protein
MLKGFKEFLARGNIVDLAVAVVIGTAFTALVTKFTDSVILPLINRIGAGGNSEYGILKIGIGGGQTIDLNVLLSAAINFVLARAPGPVRTPPRRRAPTSPSAVNETAPGRKPGAVSLTCRGVTSCPRARRRW